MLIIHLVLSIWKYR